MLKSKDLFIYQHLKSLFAFHTFMFNSLQYY